MSNDTLVMTWTELQEQLMAAEQRTRERAQELHVAMMDVAELQEDNRLLKRQVAELRYEVEQYRRALEEQGINIELQYKQESDGDCGVGEVRIAPIGD
jgi:chromosome segregation ATPase